MILWVCFLGCTGDHADPGSDPPPPVDTIPLDTVVSESYRDSVTRIYWAHPDSVLQHLRPAAFPEDVRIAVALLETSSGEGRLRFAHYLAEQGDRSVSAIVSLVDRCEDWNTLMTALQTLGKLKATRGVHSVARRLQTPNDWVRIAAAHALGDIGGDEAVESLVVALDDTSDTVVSAALIALGKTGDPSVLDVVGERLGHHNPRVRAAGVSAIGRLGGSEAARLLSPLLDDPDPGVRFKTSQGLDRIGVEASQR